MVSKTDNLRNIALTINVVNGIYDMRTKTTETKYYPEMIGCLEYGLTNLQAKEIQMGYYKIWTIGE